MALIAVLSHVTFFISHFPFDVCDLKLMIVLIEI
jgi:hypothetical protein